MSFGKHVEWDIGVGAFIIEGNDTNAGESFTTPLFIHPTDFLGVGFRPAASHVKDNRVGDYDLSVLLGWKYAFLKLGYRWVESENESLNGPHIGLSFRL